MAERKEKVEELIKKLGATFLEKESNRTSLITITKASVSPDLKKATLYISVLPENKEDYALSFAKRQRKNLREFLKKNMNIKNIPFIEIEIDKGEKNRQKIDELLREAKVN